MIKCTVHYSVLSLSLFLTHSHTYESKGFWCFRMGTGTKEEESSTGWIWAAGFNHVMTRSCLEHVLKLISLILQIFAGCGKPRIPNQWIRRHGCILLFTTTKKVTYTKLRWMYVNVKFAFSQPGCLWKQNLSGACPYSCWSIRKIWNKIFILFQVLWCSASCSVAFRTLG
jgi:hypothetical protein